MKSAEIRHTFFEYFKKHGHVHLPSSSLVPENDATLLFANAGMNQFKNLFLGLEQRPFKRAVTSQKCVRAGGKHNDLENVGFTARHHTFFEMLGNFSFGDYFKKDAIHFAWDLLTNELELPKDRLYVTVFKDDDEAADIWHKQEGVPRDRIYKFGEKDNFWRMGDVGPCGPCSEIFFDHGTEVDLDPKNPSQMGGDGDRFVEIWNNVFMQFNEDANGRTALPKPSVDTGAGLERWAAVLQGTYNNFNTDLFLPILSRACQLSRLDLEELIELEPYARRAHNDRIEKAGRNTGKSAKQVREQLAALRVLADHSRAAAFLIADGVLPSNEGRGYVLRRIMRRAIRYGRTLSADSHLFASTVQVVVDQMNDVYPELLTHRARIERNIVDETERFIHTLDQGTEILNLAIKQLLTKGQKQLDGETVFKLYDTFGFPADLTRLMAEEQGLSFSEDDFNHYMDEAKAKAKSSWKGKAINSDAAHLLQFAQKTKDLSGPTDFIGYSVIEAPTTIALLSNGKEFVDILRTGESGLLAVPQTPFYAEGGGQAGDQGEVQSKQGFAHITDTTKVNEVWLHQVQVTRGELRLRDPVELKVLNERRRNTAANHSATHLLHAALRNCLGTHVAQAGSLVDAERLRFDFTHGKPLSSAEIIQVEESVNAEIGKNHHVQVAEMGQKEAIAAGALALFGEKYGDRVRVVQMGDFSTELCGGTHVSESSQIRLFKIVAEGGVSSGVRRIEAVTGDAAVGLALAQIRENGKTRLALGLSNGLDGNGKDQAVEQVENLKKKIRDLERELSSAKGAQVDLDQLLKSGQSFTKANKTGQLVTAHLPFSDRKLLSDVADKIRNRFKSGVVILVGSGQGEDTHPVVVSVSKDLNPDVNAGKILAALSQELGGKGGGRPDFAQGAVPSVQQLDVALAKVLMWIERA